jgi:recombination protein RecT
MTTERSQVEDVRHTLGLMQSQFKSLFPSQQHVDRFVRVVMTAVQQNPDLLDPGLRVSLYAACMRCAQDGLMPDGQEAALVKYGGNTPSINYQPMIGGMMKKLRNSGEIVGAPKVHVWKEGDTFEYQLGDEEKIIHKPLLTGRGKTLGAYSIVALKSGGTSREVMTVDQIEAIRKRSRSPEKGPWATDFDEMARKTVFRRHYKKLPKSSDLDNVLAADDETFVPYTEPAQPGTSVAPAAQGQGNGSAQQQRRPAALEAVARHGGEHIEGTVTARESEPAQQQQQPQPQQQGAAGGPPKDII